MPPLPISHMTEENQFAIDKDLYDSTLSIRDEMNLISERVRKMDEHKTSVSEAVYLKVKSDYLTHYDQVRKSFEEKKQEIQSALQGLYKGKSEQESELKKHQEVLEEAKFRNFLGEFTDKKFKEVENKENSEIKRYESLLSLIQTNIKQYEDLIGGPAPALPEPPPPAPEANFEASETKKTKIPLVDESVSIAKHRIDEIPAPLTRLEIASSEEAYILESEGDYFQNDEAEAAPLVEALTDHTTALPVESLPKLKTKKTPPPEMEEPPTGKQEIKIKTEKPKTGLGFDDSISSILKSIPLDDAIEEKPLEDEIPEEALLPVEEEPSVDLPDFEEEAPLGSASNAASTEPVRAKVVCLEGDLMPPEFELEDNTSIGRSPSNDIVLKEPKVSRQHAAINLIDGNYVIVDLKSSNGIFVNGRKVEEAVLEDGDEILVGNTKMAFRAGS